MWCRHNIFTNNSIIFLGVLLTWWFFHWFVVAFSLSVMGRTHAKKLVLQVGFEIVHIFTMLLHDVFRFACCIDIFHSCIVSSLTSFLVLVRFGIKFVCLSLQMFAFKF